MKTRDKLVRALNYKSRSFELIKGDDKTKLNRDELWKIINLLDDKEKSPYKGYGKPKNGW